MSVREFELFPGAIRTLVCGRRTPSGGDMHVCLPDLKQVASMVDLKGEQQSLAVRKPAGKDKLRVFKNRHVEFRLAQSRFERWGGPR